MNAEIAASVVAENRAKARAMKMLGKPVDESKIVEFSTGKAVQS